MFFFGRKKRIYFVRHGETILNAQGIRQGAEGGLSDKGREQADFLGKRMEFFRVDTIIASPYERTKETAEIINKHLNKKIEYSDLLAERRNPKEIIGKDKDDPEVKMIVDRIDKSFHDSSLRFSDEENFQDLKVRAKKLLDFLADKSEKNILCVTHGIFLKMVAAYMLYGEKLTEADYVKLSYHNNADNAGITLCQYNSRKGWDVLAWNDSSKIV
jgi:probable phosphoglycerate mutase